MLVASCCLVLFSPILLVTAVLVAWRMGRPVLFVQPRPGLQGKLFHLYKFRTMRDLKDRHGEALPDAERLTKLGAWLRRSSLDELPELLNVIRGDMSLVGPRPLLPEYLPLYSARQARRHELRPGLTGWAQVNGRNGLSWESRLEMDVWYVEHWSFLLDLKILVRTLSTVLGSQGISAPGHVTMQKFTGARSSVHEDSSKPE